MAVEVYEIRTVLTVEDKGARGIERGKREVSEMEKAARRTEQQLRSLNRQGVNVRVDGTTATKVHRISTELDGVRRSADRAKQSLLGMDQVGGRIKSFVAGAFVGGAAVTAVDSLGGAIASIPMKMFALNSSLEQSRARFNAFTHDVNLTNRVIDELRREADITPFDTEEMIQAGSALFNVARQANLEFMGVMRTAEILAASNPLEGLQGAAFALREAAGGDFQSLIERFNISRGLINQLKTEGLSGIALVEEAARRTGLTFDLVGQLANTAEGRWSTLSSTVDNFLQKVGERAFQEVSEGLGDINESMVANKEATDESAESLGEFVGGAARAGISAFTVYLGYMEDKFRGIAWYANAAKDATAWARDQTTLDVPEGAPGNLPTLGQVEADRLRLEQMRNAALFGGMSPGEEVSRPRGHEFSFFQTAVPGHETTPFAPFNAPAMDPFARPGITNEFREAQLRIQADAISEQERQTQSLAEAWGRVNAELAANPEAMAAVQSGTQALVGDLYAAQTALDALDVRISEIGTRKGQLAGWKSMIQEGLDTLGESDPDLRAAGQQAIAQIDQGMREANIEGMKATIDRVFEGDKVVELGQKIDDLGQPIDEQIAAVDRYEVQWGDTLTSIAAKYGTTVQEIQRLNDILNADLIYTGELLAVTSSGASFTSSVSDAEFREEAAIDAENPRQFGGPITEPVVGIGLRTGQSWSFAESGIEHVSTAGGGGGSPIVFEQGSIVIQTRELDEASAPRVARMLVDHVAGDLARLIGTVGPNVVGQGGWAP